MHIRVDTCAGWHAVACKWAQELFVSFVFCEVVIVVESASFNIGFLSFASSGLNPYFHHHTITSQAGTADDFLPTDLYQAIFMNIQLKIFLDGSDNGLYRVLVQKVFGHGYAGYHGI